MRSSWLAALSALGVVSAVAGCSSSAVPVAQSPAAATGQYSPEPIPPIFASPQAGPVIPRIPGETGHSWLIAQRQAAANAAAAAATAANTASTSSTTTTTVPVSSTNTRTAVTPTSTAPPADFAAAYTKVTPAVGFIGMTDCKGDDWGGTGFLVAPNLVLTADHVLRGYRTWFFVLGGHKYTGTVIGTSENQDVALIRLNRRPGETPLTLQTQAPAVGSRVAAVGYALGLGADNGTPTIASGDVSGVDRTIGNQTGMLQASFNTNHGASGGPVITPTGDVVGIVDLVVPDAQYGPQNVQLAIGAATAQKLVAKWTRQPQVQGPSC